MDYEFRHLQNLQMESHRFHIPLLNYTFKTIWIIPDVVEYVSTNRQHVCNLIIGMETLTKPRAVIDFKKSTIEIYSVRLPVQSLLTTQDP